MVFSSSNDRYFTSSFLSVLQKSSVTFFPSPASASCSRLTEEESSPLVTVISLTEGAELSRSPLAPVGEEMPRPTPHWKLLTSIQCSCPFAVTSPLMSPYFI